MLAQEAMLVREMFELMTRGVKKCVMCIYKGRFGSRTDPEGSLVG